MKRRKQWISHIIRHNGYLVKLIERKFNGRVATGRFKKRFIKQIAENVREKSYKEMKRWKTRL